MSKPSDNAIASVRGIIRHAQEWLPEAHHTRTQLLLADNSFDEIIAECALIVGAQAAEDLAEYMRAIETAEMALRNLVYETTHLSPQRDDGAHDCRISALALRYGREALAEIEKLRKE